MNLHLRRSCSVFLFFILYYWLGWLLGGWLRRDIINNLGGTPKIFTFCYMRATLLLCCCLFFFFFHYNFTSSVTYVCYLYFLAFTLCVSDSYLFERYNTLILFWRGFFFFLVVEGQN